MRFTNQKKINPMRLKIKLSKSNTTLPINNQHIVNGFFHKLLGENNKFHDGQSDYCISNLRGGKFVGEDKISFENGGYIMVSSQNLDIYTLLLMGMIKHKSFYGDIQINGFEYLPNEVFYSGFNHFKTLSPILLKDKGVFKTIEDADFISKLTEQTKRKLKAFNPKLAIDNLEIAIGNHSAHKVRKVLVKNVINKASQCQLTIKCDKEVAETLYNIGIGNSAGSGFGMVYKTESKSLY